MKLLGSHWKFIINDITEGNDGNDERFAYLYDSRRVEFTGLAGEIVLWKELTKDSTDQLFQLKRTPYITGFRAGWKSFAIINLHLQPNNDLTSKEIRKKEVELLTKAIKSKLESNNFWSENLILLGDFNLYKNNTDIEDLLNDNGFYESDLTKGLNTNTARSSAEPFDRILFRETEYFKLPSGNAGNTGGVIDILSFVFKEEDYHIYKKEMEDSKGDPSTLTSENKYKRYFRDYWRKNQISDHKPIWIEIEIDSSDVFLKDKLEKLEN